MKEYQELQNPGGQVTGYTIDDMTIPNAPGNKDYQNMLAEVEAGEAIILPWVEPEPAPPVPVVIKGDQYIVVDAQGVEHDITAKLLAL